MLQKGTGVSWHSTKLLILISGLVLMLITDDSEGFVTSPKILTKDGNLIFESGLNRNISFNLNGKSRLMINDKFDLMDLILLNGVQNKSVHSSEWYDGDSASLGKLATELSSLKMSVLGPQGLTTRLQRQQNRTRMASALLRRYQNRLTALEANVQSLSQRLQLDNCRSNPCENGGSCLNTFNGFICKCTKSFEGSNCEKDLNECALYEGTDLGCQNGGQCINQFGGYNCICSPGWYGIHCTQRKGDCLQASSWELCGHGTCVSSNDNFGYKCICDQGWKTNGLTPACLTDVDECAESHPPCSTKCINLPGSFTCGPCAAGLTGNGINCRDIDECIHQNGGCSVNPRVPCINTYGSSHCGECPLGWTGDGRTCTSTSTEQNGMHATCSANNICHPEASCAVISNTVVCTCKTGMKGTGIGVNGCLPGMPTNCNSLPCLNGGTCVNTGSSYTCLCPAGYRPPNCMPMTRNPCEPSPCRNQGICQVVNETFQCHCRPGFTGRLCDSNYSRCGGLLAGDVGRLKYPLSSLYDHKSQCAWVIRTNETKVLNVTFNYFDVEDSTDCRFDWLQINDGRSTASQVIGRFCGQRKPMGGNIISSTNYLYLWFRADNSTAKEGFELEWQSIDPICGGVFEIVSHGTIATPGSPGNYPKNRDCIWQLRAPNNKRIKLTFFSLQIENHINCNYDYIEIRDTISEVVLEKFCNSSQPAPITLPTNEASIFFHSDNEGSDTGFQIYYSTEDRVPGCGGTFTATKGTIRSPTLFEENISCEYDIKVATSESIRLRFTKFEMGLDDCIEIYDVNVAKQIRSLQSKHCGSYESAPLLLHSVYNAVQIKYYASSNTAAFQLEYTVDCSYTFESESDVIVSPSYPKLDNTERLCAYKILTDPNTIISLSVIDFELNDKEDDEGLCDSTFLVISNGIDKQILGTFCGNNTPNDMVAKSNMLVLELHTSLTSKGRGFKIEYRATPMGKSDCGGVYTKSGQTIRLQTGDDGQYDHNMECYWIIMAPSGKGIMINWKSFNLEESTDCSFDYVEIYDTLPSNPNAQPYDRYCSTPPSFMTHSRTLYIKFVSDFSDAGEGFEATIEFVDLLHNCGSNILSSTGRITTPDWPANYTSNLDCIWTITSPPGTQLELQIEAFDLEQSANCSSDWLEVRNGGSEKSPLVGLFCGQSIPQKIPSFTNQMHVHFHSDQFVNARGFQLNWYPFATGCGGTLIGERGQIASPLYPNPYPASATCEWRVRVPKGSSIEFVVDDFALEELNSCYYDYVEIYEGFIKIGAPLCKLCFLDDQTPLHYFTISNEALVHFNSDSSNNDRGFLLSYKANCTNTIYALHGTIESPNFGVTYYRNDINCSWTIKAPKGNRIALELTYFENFNDGSQLYLTELSPNGTAISHTLTGMGTFNSSENTLIIHQNSSFVSFSLEYAMTGCIQVFNRDTGDFHTPGYPKTYPNDLECLWQIKTVPGRAIELSIFDLDVELSPNCTKDVVIVSSQFHSNNTKERYCGKRSSLIVTSAAHHLYVRFSSNLINNGHGFNATYRVINSVCGGVIQSKQGTILSPNYPLTYPRQSDCEWTIEVAKYHSIQFTMEELELEDNSFDNCQLDYVEALYSPTDSDSDIEVRLFKLCGNLNPNEKEWTVPTNKATVRFVTDDSVEHKGFKLHFEESCGERIFVDNSDYNYFEFHEGGVTNTTCEWQLIAKDSSKHIVFSITDVKLSMLALLAHETEEVCAQKGVQIYDGDDDKSPVRAKFCKSHPPAVISYGQSLTIRVPNDIIAEVEGYYQIMDGTCGEMFEALMGKFASPYYPSSYPVNTACEWYIRGSAGNNIVLTIESMDLEASDGCNKDYLEVREYDERGRLLGIFCGRTPPPALTGVQTLWLKFNSDNDNVGTGFLASYNYALHIELNDTSGIIESPTYPSPFHSSNPYTWRITVNKKYLIVLTIKYIVDIALTDVKLYDGYSDIGMELDFSNTHVLRSSTNILFIRASRGPFQFEWDIMSKEAVRTNQTMEEIFEKCGAKTLVALDASPLSFTSPGYPFGYEANLNCSWVFASRDTTSHAVLQINTLELEDFAECSADYIVISTSSDLLNWQRLDQMCKKAANSFKKYHGTPYLKLEFHTDSGINKTGFSVMLSTACGSILTAPRGFVNISAIAEGSTYQAECVWFIRVRQSRRMRIKFPESVLHNFNDTTSCRSHFIVRNGIDQDSPFIGKGKFCDNNITDILETTSNRAYIKFVRLGYQHFRASFQYEEIANECSDDIVLSDKLPMDQMRTISSPNYPNIPNPHTECIWRVTAPFHHVISVNFVGQFDLMEGSAPIASACDREYVQLHDGATELMPLMNRYCGKRKPNSITTSGNVLRIKYFTDVSEPHSGFQLNVSIGQCGGTYHENEGTITPPILSTASDSKLDYECVYLIETEPGSTIQLQIEEINIPSPTGNCSAGSHLLLQEIDTSGEGDNITDTVVVCGIRPKHYVVETNKLVIRYRVKGTPSQSENQFKINYNALGSRCGDLITESVGILTTPNYPIGVSRPTHCIWRLIVPKGQRIKIEFLDYDTGSSINATSSLGHIRSFRGRIIFANDHQLKSVIARITENPPAVLYSTDNTMAIDAFLLSFSRHRGFKLRFTSEEYTEYCNHYILSGGEDSRSLHFEGYNETNIYCNYNLKVDNGETLALHVEKYEKYPFEYTPSLWQCIYSSPMQLAVNNKELLPELMCNNNTNTVRLPFTVTLSLFASKRNKLRNLELGYQTYRCGGLHSAFLVDDLTISQPNMSDTHVGKKLECAWAIWPTLHINSESLENHEYLMGDAQLELKLTTNFKGSCENQYLLLYNGPNQNSPHLGRYCNQASAENLVVGNGLFFEYYSNSYERESTFNLTLTRGSGCGGQVTYPYRDISFRDQYKNNVECIWEISTEPGFHLGLSFLDRFFIESSTDCRKDYLKVQQRDIGSSNWTDLATICGRIPPPYVNTTTHEMRLIVRTDEDTVGDGFTAHFERNCGGILYAQENKQQLASPGYPKTYGNRLYCNYTILPAEGTRDGILVRFVDFDIEQPPHSVCSFDNVTVVVQERHLFPKKTVLCGKNKNYEFRASQFISVSLYTDETFGTKGFLLEYSTNVCGGVVTNTSVIQSPREHTTGYFPPNSNCYWNLTAPEGYKIVIKFEEIDFEHHMDCFYDSVAVFEGLIPSTEQRLAKFCGNITRNLPTISISSNTGLIHSFSDNRDSSRGFKALVSFVKNCDQFIDLDVNNATYELSNIGTYANKQDCSYTFKTLPDKRLIINFNSFHVEESPNCDSDYLEVHDGAGPFADLIGKFCGHILPANLMTSQNVLYMRFVSDSDVTSAGFGALISSAPRLCGRSKLEIHGNETLTLRMPNDDSGRYASNLNCFWGITSAKTIHLKFDKFDVGVPNAMGECDRDNLKIYNSDENGNLVDHPYGSHLIFNGQITSAKASSILSTEHIYCGNHLPDDYFSLSKEIYLKFQSGSDAGRSGFSLTITPVFGCFRNFTGTQGRIILSDTEDHCDIYIKAPENYSLSIYYAEVSFAEYDCNAEYIEVFNAHTNATLQKVCTMTEPGKSLFTNTNELRMRIKMNSYFTKYDMTYLASQNGPGCGGDLYNTAGIITNPFYPENVRNNSDCRWNIRVPSNVHVLLSFDEFNMGAKNTCHSDYLQIIEYEIDGTEQVMRQFCGGDVPPKYISDRSYLTVRFHKTFNYDGTGWVINFRGVPANYKI